MSLEAVLMIILIILVLCFGIGFYFTQKKRSGDSGSDEVINSLTRLENRLNMLDSANSALRQELSSIVQISVKNMGDIMSQSQSERLLQLENRFKTFSLESEQKLENIRATMETRLSDIKNENTRSLEQMRKTVD